MKTSHLCSGPSFLTLTLSYSSLANIQKYLGALTRQRRNSHNYLIVPTPVAWQRLCQFNEIKYFKSITWTATLQNNIDNILVSKKPSIYCIGCRTWWLCGSWCSLVLVWSSAPWSEGGWPGESPKDGPRPSPSPPWCTPRCCSGGPHPDHQTLEISSRWGLERGVWRRPRNSILEWSPQEYGTICQMLTSWSGWMRTHFSLKIKSSKGSLLQDCSALLFTASCVRC